MIDLDAIRKRDAADMEILPALEDTALCIDDEELRNAIHMVRDRNGLLTYIDKLREAAGKVTCHRCGNTGKALQSLPGSAGAWVETTCPDCADLRALLQERQP